MRSSPIGLALLLALPIGASTLDAQSSLLVLVEGDPTTDILQTRRIMKVWKRGVEATRVRYEK